MPIHQPNFFMVGAPRAGTTSLYKYLAAHPQIYMSPIKEPNYFAQSLFTDQFFKYRKKPLFDLKSYLAGSRTQRVHFAYVTDWDDYLGLFRNVRSERVIGEASTFYLQCAEAPAKIKEAAQDARILIVLRDPVERAYSEYRMNRAIGFIRESFASAMERQFSEEQPEGLIAGSLYCEPVRRYLAAFGHDRVLILLHGDTVQEHVFDVLCRFLGVSRWEGAGAHRLNSARLDPRSRWINFKLYRSGLKDRLSYFAPEPLKTLGKYIYYSRRQRPRLAAEERRRMAHYFQADIAALETLLDRDLSSWLH